MHRLIFCAVLLFVGIEGARLPRDEKYTSKYDNVNVDEVLKSERLLKNYINCMLDKGKCSPDAEELKKNLPDALTNDCAKCTTKQKTSADKVVVYLIKNKPTDYAKMETKYDPTGIFRKKYQTRLDSAIKASS